MLDALAYTLMTGAVLGGFGWLKMEVANGK